MTANQTTPSQRDEMNYPLHQTGSTLEPPEVHYVRADRSNPKTSKTLLYSAMITLSVVLCVFLYLSRAPKDGAIPLIKAETGPIKLRPQQQDNVVPHSEKTIYGELGPHEPGHKVENLLAEPEKPQAQNPTLPADFMKAFGEPEEGDLTAMDSANLHAANPQDSQPLLSLSATNDSAAETPEPTPDEQSSSVFSQNDEELKPAAPLAEETVSKEKAPREMERAAISVTSSKIVPSKAVTSTTIAAGPFYRVQIYSAASQKGAEQQWNAFKKKSGGLLTPYSPIIQRIDLGANVGIRYRLQLGQFSKDAAQTFCTKLKKHGIDCWAVRQ